MFVKCKLSFVLIMNNEINSNGTSMQEGVFKLKLVLNVEAHILETI